MIYAYFNAIEKFLLYNGVSMHFGLYIASILFLLVYQYKRPEHQLMTGQAIAFSIIYLFPLSAYIIIKLIGESVVWRMFWLLPMPLVISYVATLLVGKCRTKGHKIFVISAVLISIALTGSFIVTPENYDKPTNFQKLPQTALDVVDLVESDAATRGVTDIKMVVPDDLVCYVFQYKAGYLMPYARDMIRGLYQTDTEATKLHNTLIDEPLDAEAVCEQLRLNNCNYIAISGLDAAAQNIFREKGYLKIGNVNTVDIYTYFQ